MRTIKHIQDVVDWGLCVGCGACYYVCTKRAVSLHNIEHVGIRPKFKKDACLGCQECLSSCPGFYVDARMSSEDSGDGITQNPFIGPTLGIWEGFAAEEQIRFRASSGGALTAIALYCIENENMEFVLHTGMDPIKPWMNTTVPSKNRS